MKNIMTAEEICEIIDIMMDLFPKMNSGAIKSVMRQKLHDMTREEADRSLRPVKAGRMRFIDWIAQDPILSTRDREYEEALKKVRA